MCSSFPILSIGTGSSRSTSRYSFNCLGCLIFSGKFNFSPYALTKQSCKQSFLFVIYFGSHPPASGAAGIKYTTTRSILSSKWMSVASSYAIDGLYMLTGLSISVMFPDLQPMPSKQVAISSL